MNFRFENQAMLQLLWLLPALAALTVWSWSRSGKTLQKVFGERVAGLLTATLSQGRRKLRLGLELAALACFIVALARPQLGTALTQIKSEGVEMMFLLDVSNSMLAEDVKPNRLEQAKKEIGRLLDRMSGHRAGVVVFAGSAFAASPLTTDYGALKMFLESFNTDSVSSQGTNVKGALEEAEASFNRGGVDDDQETRVTRVIIVVSDGEDQEKGAVEMAKKLSSKGTFIYSLGFGTEAGAPIPDRDERGYLRGYKKDDKGQVILSTHHGTFLTEVAAAGRGRYYHASVGGNQIELLEKEIGRLRKSQFDQEVATDYDERYQPFAILGFILLLAALLTPERGGRPAVWKGRFEGVS